MTKPLTSLHFSATALALMLLLSGCAYMPQLSPALAAGPRAKVQAPAQEAMAPIRQREDMLFAVTEDNQLVSFNASTPGQLFSKVPLSGLSSGERLVGMDFRISSGELVALSTAGRLVRLHLGTGAASSLAKGAALPEGWAFGTEPPRAFAAGDLLAGNTPRIVATAQAPSTAERAGLRYGIDAAFGYLTVQGASGQLQSVGPLNIDRFDRATLDIAHTDRAAYLITSRKGAEGSRLYELNLSSGQARLIGAIASPTPVVGLAIEP